MYDLLAPTSPHRIASINEVEDRSREHGQASARVLARMLDVVDYALLLVLEDGHVVFANQVARSELDHRHPLQLMGQELRVRLPQDVSPLRSALSSATQRGLQRLLTVGQGAVEQVTLSIVPMCDAAADQSPTAMLAFGKRKVCDDISTDAFARHHKLTPAELRVLKQLCAGRRPAEIAVAQGVAISTVRSQIGGLREKTGAPSIGAMIREVAKLPPMFSVFRSAA